MAGPTNDARRALRRVTLGSGPLKRGSDRLELMSRLLCAVVLLLALPVALTVGTVACADASAQAREQAATRHEVEAVLLADAPGASGTKFGTLTVATPATWWAPDGTAREGGVRVPRRAVAGDLMPIWVDSDGALANRPLDTAGVLTAEYLTGLFTYLSLATAAVGGHLGACRGLWALRAGQWGREWQSVEPQWTGRR